MPKTWSHGITIFIKRDDVDCMSPTLSDSMNHDDREPNHAQVDSSERCLYIFLEMQFFETKESVDFFEEGE